MLMITTTQEQILEMMADMLEEQPEMRFGQLVASLALFAKGPIKSATWDVDDDEFLTAAKRHLENLRKRRESKTEVQKLVATSQYKVVA